MRCGLAGIKCGRGQIRPAPTISRREHHSRLTACPATAGSVLGKPLLRKQGACGVAMGRYWQCRDIVTVRWHDPCPSCYVTRMIAAHSPVWNIGVVSSGVGCSRNYKKGWNSKAC